MCVCGHVCVSVCVYAHMRTVCVCKHVFAREDHCLSFNMYAELVVNIPNILVYSLSFFPLRALALKPKNICWATCSGKAITFSENARHYLKVKWIQFT